LERPSRRNLELNEVRWWSNWVRLIWFGPSGYLLTSEDFGESFFNRAGALTCAGVGGTAAWAEKKLADVRMDSTVLVYASCVRATQVLEDSGYRPVDSMTVLLSNRPMETGSAVQPRIITQPPADRWTRAYLEAFYGDGKLRASVTPIVIGLLNVRAVTLLEARIGGETAGVMAIFRTKGLAGVYCLGTVPRYRRRGVATGLLQRAKEIAEAEGRKLILQSLASEGAERFYLERGFIPLYSKHILLKKNSNALRKGRI